jgi:eukaryotic-like serine/threonine-protein kinase
MDPDRWQQIDELFNDVLERAPKERKEFLKGACDGDEELRREVEVLLAAREQAGMFMAKPVLAEAVEDSAKKENQSLAGQQLGPYEILSLLGRGGMGEVYQARDTRLDRMAALKILPIEVAADPGRLRRFVREAKAASALNHPNIATIYEIGESDGIHWIAMELVEGQTLAERMKDRQLGIDEILGIGVQTAEGLEAAHKKGIIHRDIKPANLMLTPEGRVKVLDFGLAKRLHLEEPGQDMPASTEPHTVSGLIMGTVEYMSPEQVLGDEIDARGDLYSLGVTLYQLATRVLPFHADTPTKTMDRILHGEPEAISRLNKNLPGKLEQIIRQCLEKDREKRYQSATALLADLRLLQRDTAENPRIVETAARRGYRFIAPVHREGMEQVALKPCLEKTHAEENGATARNGSKNDASVGVNSWKTPHWLSAVAILLIVVAASMVYLWKNRDSAPSNRTLRLAVLPFKNLSGNPETENLAEGLTITFTNELGQIRSFEMISSRSVSHLKKQEKSVPEIARELKVDWLADPVVRFQSDKVSISLQLIEGATERLLWASPTYERKMSELANLQRELAREVAFQLKVISSPAEKKRLSQIRNINPEAYKFYLQGRFASNNPWGSEGSAKSLIYYQKAINLDPTLSDAYAGLADAYVWLVSFDIPVQEARQKARIAAEKALLLDDSSPVALASMAMVKYTLEWDWKEAGVLFQKAFSLNPNNVDSINNYAFYLTGMGRFDEAIQAAKIQAELDPFTPISQCGPGWCYFYARRYDEGISWMKRVIKERYVAGLSDRSSYFNNLGLNYLGKGMYQEAFEAWKDDPPPGVLFKLGKKAEAEKKLKQTKAKPQSILTIEPAGDYAMMGRNDEAFWWLEHGFAKRDPWLVLIKVLPPLDPLRADPRYKDLLRRMNFPE